MTYDFDYIVIGSGFGGSVSALRLSEKGYSVGVLEMGKRYRTQDFPETNWNLPKFLWLPMLRLHGFFRMSLFSRAWVLSGVGVGGGSLVYANTSLVPLPKVWKDKRWEALEDWEKVMPAHYATAKKMLGVTTTPRLMGADLALQEGAEAQGYGDSFYKTDVAVYFGEEGQTVEDPYFNGEGPKRTGCTFCGGCMVGCKVGAKNTLDKNYLYLAEKKGAKVIAETKVVDVRPLGAADGSDGYEIHTVSSTSFFKKKKIYRTKGVVFSAGVLGTVKLLLELKAKDSLPNISDRCGDFVRTNSESIIGVEMNDKHKDMSEGVAIGSGFHLDQDTHIEAVRYKKGSDLLGSMSTLLTDGKSGFSRILSWMGVALKNPLAFLKSFSPLGFARKSLILLVMQTLDSSIQMKLKRKWYWPFSKILSTQGPKIPAYIPQANDFARKLAEQQNATATTSITEILFDIPTTAHILGGAAMGSNEKEGVIDAKNRMFNYKNMLVCDGSMIGANLGVNPSLTITALTERAMSFVPEKKVSEVDTMGKPVSV
jgi:cholesterol oxidase